MPSSSKALMDATKKRAEKLQAKGKPVDFKELLRMEPDGGTTNIRNVKSKHWTRWLGVENRCVVPFNSFSEFNKAEGGDIWFALDESRPLACFAGIWTNWTSVRKVKEGETTNDLFAFLTTEPNAEVGAIHPKAMPVILTTPDEVETWMTAPPDEALKLQRPLPDGALRIVARGVKEDPAEDSLGRLLRPRQRRDLALAGDLACESGARSRRWCSRLLGDCLEIHPIHAPEMAIEILETTAIHEVVVVSRRRIDHAAGALGLADEIVDLSAAIGRYANQNLAGGLGVGNLLGGKLPILVVGHQHRMDRIGKYHA